MVLGGTVRNGVVVLDPTSALREGTRVRVEPESESTTSARRGSPKAVLSVSGTWDGPSDEIDALLAQVQTLRDEDIDPQHRQDR